MLAAGSETPTGTSETRLRLSGFGAPAVALLGPN
jgi:hypothetical protein